MMQAWLDYFEHNRKHRAPVPWEMGIRVPPPLRAPLVRSLQKFQLGESGEGRNLKLHAADTGDALYAAAMDLFIREEQEHARLLGQILRELKAPLLESDWSDWCFVALRHRFGLHHELMILLLPEMIAKRYFHALRAGPSDPVLRAVFGQIERDEDGHLAFHIAFLRRAFETMSFSRRILVLILWRLVFRATCVVFILDHRALLRAVGVKPRDFWRDCGRIFDEVAASIFSPAYLLAPVKLLSDQAGCSRVVT